MPVTIDLPPELEIQLNEEAAREGLDTPDYIVTALKERIRPGRPEPLTENELLRRISQGLPDEV